MTETMTFGTDVSRLLDIVAHALYSNRDVFLRELISNASDACDRLRYEAIAKPDLTSGDSDYHVRVWKDTKTRTVTVRDNGIGMSRDELVENLGTIAKSGTRGLIEQIGNGDVGTDRMSLIGQFGVGFYASFMVAHKVEVVSARAGEQECWHWESDGRTGFSVRAANDAERALLKNGRGTIITLHINDDASEYLIDEKLKEVIQTWSDHISIPVYLNAPESAHSAEQPVNRGSALWARPKHEITEQQYTDFYKHIGHGWDEPLMTSHWRAEGKIEYSALLFVPTMRPWDLYDPTRKTSVRLYVRRVFITDDCDGLMYPWMRFVRGVIDSEDMPLNISREMLQHNPLVAKIRSGVARKILGDLDRVSKDDPDKFATFWGQFGSVLKEGLYDATEHREDLLKIVRFRSSHDDAASLVSLADYVSRMKEGQKDIYYLSGENIETLKNSPQLEGFKARGIEVLFFTDTIDDFWLQSVMDYDGKSFKSVTKGDIDLGGFTRNDSKEDDVSEDTAHPELDKLLVLIRETLREDISDVRLSGRLTDSPVCLIAADDAVDLRMERVLRLHQNYTPPSKRVMELNPDHALVKRLGELAHQDADGDTLKDAAHLLLDQARIIQGEPVPNPSRFARTMSRFMARGI